MNKKTYPASLQKYNLLYGDGSKRILYANGSTHAWAISKSCWPNQKIKEIHEMDDSWKTQSEKANELI
jgi:hypothetical protein